MARGFFTSAKDLAEAANVANNMRVIDRYIRDLNRRLDVFDWRFVAKKRGKPGGGTPPPPPDWP